MTIHVARIYDEPSGSQGYRVLVDRLWPRGISRERAQLDLWAKDLAPSPELRTWFNHQPERFGEFSARYQAELAANPAVAEFMQAVAGYPDVTLLYAAKDSRVNHAVVLQAYLGQLERPRP